jgi:uncharacterized protein YjdB
VNFFKCDFVFFKIKYNFEKKQILIFLYIKNTNMKYKASGVVIAIAFPLMGLAQTSVPVRDFKATHSSWSLATSAATPVVRPEPRNKAMPTPLFRKTGNYNSVSTVSKLDNTEVTVYNKGHENDPEIGVLFPNAPCTDCYELLERRTETQKYFVKTGTAASSFILQSSSDPMHYKDATGNWRTISDRLEPVVGVSSVFSTKGRTVAIKVNTAEGYVQMSSPDGSLTVNRELELIYVAPGGVELSQGKANWSVVTLGDDGMKVKDIWPGIDMEIAVAINRLETNFIINHAIPAWSGGHLLVRDHMQPGQGIQIMTNGNPVVSDALTFEKAGGESPFQITRANVYELNNATPSLQNLDYHVSGNVVDIELPGSWLNRPASAYPIVIDPLLVSGTASTGGFIYYPALGVTACTNTNSVLVPGGATISDITINYGVTGVVGSASFHKSVHFAIYGSCSYSMDCSGWTPSGISGAECFYSGASFWGVGTGWGWLPGCTPAFSCASYTLPFQMYNEQMYSSTPSCAQTVFASHTPFTVNVIGTTPAVTTILPSAPTLICTGGTAALTATPSGGTWSVSGAAATVSASGLVTGVSAGTATVSYIVPVSSCSTNDTKIVTVHAPVSVAAIGGPSRLCAGTSVVLTDATTGGSWTSSNTAVGTINSSGSLTGLSAGTTTVSYTFVNACGTYAASRIMTVDAVPAPGTISGGTGVCVSGTTTLTSTVSGGTWQSGTTSVATIGSSSGIVSGISSGISVITYTRTNTYCSAVTTTVVTVSITPTVSAVTGIGNICQASAFTFTNAAAGGVWTSSAPSIANVGSFSGRVTGISGGTAQISYTIANTCNTVTATSAVTVNPVLTGVMGNITTMAGNGLSGHTGDGGLATAARTHPVYAVATDTAGNIFIADSVGDIRKITPAGIITNYVTGHYVGAMTGDNAGNIYFIDLGTSSGVYKVSSTGVVSTFLAGVSNAIDICADRQGNLYVAFVDGNQVIRLTPPSTTPTVYAGNGSLTVSGDGGPATAAGLGHWIRGVVTDAADNLYISTEFPGGGFDRVRKVAFDGTITTVVNSAGAAGFSGDGGPATAAEVNGVIDIATDALGKLYSADYNNARIRLLTPTTGIISTMAGTGLVPYSGDNILPTAANIDPYNVLIDRNGNVIISDASNHRVRRIPHTAGPITGTATVCVAATTTLSCALYPAYSSWVSSNTAIATVGSTGIVTGIAAGTAIITYHVRNACSWVYSTRVVTVSPLPVAGTLSGVASVCVGSSGSLTASLGGGTWLSASTSVATVSPSGTVMGVSAGIATISYTITNSCGTATATIDVTTAPLPDAGIITGDATSICVAQVANLSDPVSGGVWGNTGTHISVSTGGIATGVSVGDDTATYAVTDGTCTAKARYPISVTCEAEVGLLHGLSGTLHVTPNPSTGTFNVWVNEVTSEMISVTIMDATGRVVKAMSMPANRHVMVTLSQPPGVYLLTAISAGFNKSVKIVVLR